MAVRCDTCHETADSANPLFKIVEIDMRPDSAMKGSPVLLDLHQKCIAVRLVNRSGRAYMKVKVSEVKP